MTSNLIIPRISVFWGKQDLVSWKGGQGFPEGDPLVFDASVSIQSQSRHPSGALSWNPTGAAYKIYEDFITNHVDEQIVIEFYYAGGKKIAFFFIWTGQTISYGNDMSVRLTLASETVGLVNAVQRAHAIVADTPISHKQSLTKVARQFSIQDGLKIEYEQKASEDMDSSTLNNMYGQSQTAASAIQSLVTTGGNIDFWHNIGQAGLVIFAPFTWKANTGNVINGATLGQNETPKPSQRYGYLVGPGIIDRLVKDFQWAPPQLTNTSSPSTTTQVTNPDVSLDEQTRTPEVKPDKKQKEASVPTSAPIGTANGSVTPGISNANNPNGPDKKLLLNQENQSKLSGRIFLCPILVGLKPHDILYVPSLGGDYIEDWIVQSVDYSQTDGGVYLSVAATRIYGNGNLMNEAAGKAFQAQAKKLRTLEDWQQYAWPKLGAVVPPILSARGYGEVADY